MTGRRTVLVLAWAALLAAWLVYLWRSGSSPAGSLQAGVDAARGAWWAVPVFVLAYAARGLVLFPASLLTIAGGVLFGPVVGVVVTVVAANASAMVAYAAGRSLTAPPTMAETDASTVARWSNRLRHNSFTTVMVMRLAFLPYDLVNYLCGFLRVHQGAFLAATAIGSLPGTVTFVLAGASVRRLDAGVAGFDLRVFAISVALFVVSLVGARLVQRRAVPIGSDPRSDTDLGRGVERR